MPGSSTPDQAPTSVKIVVAGGFGAGKTTLVGAISEIVPLTTEAILTSAGESVDDLSKVPGKTSTTVAMDFGRITLDPTLVLYLFGTPGQDRFWFMWDELVRGAVGAVVLADTRRLRDSFAPIDFFENRRLPYIVAVNLFDGAPRYRLEDVRSALAVDVPVLACDARARGEVRDLLITLVDHALKRRTVPGPVTKTPLPIQSGGFR
jgi:signal recognition particle receptor subunit beta